MKRILVALALLAPLSAAAEPLVAAPVIDAFKEVCNNLIPDIENNYNAANLELIPDSYSMGELNDQPVAINCMYYAVVPRTTQRLVVLARQNTTKNTFTTHINILK